MTQLIYIYIYIGTNLRDGATRAILQEPDTGRSIFLVADASTQPLYNVSEQAAVLSEPRSSPEYCTS
jgi:hypothetical protein